MVIIRLILLIVGLLILLISLLFAYYYQAYDATTFTISIMVPISYSVILLALRKERTFVFSYLAYFFSLVDDAPVYFDSIFTWPEVTGGWQHLFLEGALHFLSLIFMLMAMQSVLEGKRLLDFRLSLPLFLLAVGFILCYAQNLPFEPFTTLVHRNWYVLDIWEHFFSVIFFLASLHLAKLTRK